MEKATITFYGVELDIYFDYQPEEKAVMYYSDGSGYPGCAEQVEINAIEHKGDDMTDMLMHLRDKIEDRLYKHIHEGQIMGIRC